MVLLLVNAILLVLGMFVESVAIMIITFPIFLPLMERIHVDPTHFGVILVLNLMIGLVTPPVGMALYAVSSISGVSIWEMFAEMWPYVLALIAVLAVITYAPDLVMWCRDGRLREPSGWGTSRRRGPVGERVARGAVARVPPSRCCWPSAPSSARCPSLDGRLAEVIELLMAG
jgi:TRAP-type uncharacterized transport system fused permease subunit